MAIGDNLAGITARTLKWTQAKGLEAETKLVGPFGGDAWFEGILNKLADITYNYD
jgi:hypothetical protein